MIPDVPYSVKEQIKREKYLTQKILHETNLKLVTKHMKLDDDETTKNTEDDVSKEGMDLDF